MNTEFRFEFEKGSNKHICPNCNKKRFVRYLDSETGEYLPNQYGRCDREIKCGYHADPYSDGYLRSVLNQEKWITSDQIQKKTIQVKKVKAVTGHRNYFFIPYSIFDRTRAGYEKNIFIQNLLQVVPFPFEVPDIEKIISLYHLGTVQNGYRAGSITFPFIDKSNNVRAIQVKQFDRANHTIGTDFLHSIIEKHHIRKNIPLPEWLKAYNNNELKVSCLFGEHLLKKYPYNPIALVEAPKTAIYGTLYFGFPENATNLLWIAVYNLSSFNLQKCLALKGRNVFLFPDLSRGGIAYKKWKSRAEDIQDQLPGTFFQVSDLLERLAPEEDKLQGKDIADYLIELDWRLFRKHTKFYTPTSEHINIRNHLGEKSENGEALKKTFLAQSEETIITNLAFLDGEEKVFIKTPFNDTYTVYPSINHYNNRLCLPEFINREKVNVEWLKKGNIDLDNLKIILN